MNNQLLISNADPEVVEKNKTGADHGASFSGLDPILGSLGQLIGLLSSLDDITYTLNKEWFTDPVSKTMSGVTENAEQFTSLLAKMLGEAGGNALGIPVQDPALLGTWNPIMYQGEPTGLYIVSYQKTEIKEEQVHTYTAIGLGVLHDWLVTTDNPLLKVKVWGLVPFLKLGNGAVEMTFSTPGYPISLGVAVEGSEPGKALVDINGVSFNGIKASLSADLAVSNPFDLSLQVINLKLPGQLKGTTRSLADLAAISGQEMLDTAASLFVGALSDVFPSQQQRIHYLAPLFGLSSQVPSSDVRMPVLEWYKLFTLASSPESNVKQPFINWFNTLCADPELLKTWLGCLLGFLGNDTPVITGNGLRTDPFEVPLITVADIGQLNFNVATLVSETGIRYFYPGLGFNAKGVALGTSDAVFTIGASLELGEFVLTSGAESALLQIQFDFSFDLSNKTSGTPLIAYDEYSFGSLIAGLQLGSSGQLVPRFLLNQVKTPDTAFDSINLLSPGQLADTGASFLSSALKTLLDIPKEPQQTFQERVGALIGLIAPNSAGTHWPTDLIPPFSPTGMANSISNPLEAWAKYYLETLQYGQDIEGRTAFTYLVKEFAAMLQYGAETVAIVVNGEGTPASPWQAGISIENQTLPAYFTAWQETTANKGIRLVLGLALAPEITVASTEIVPSLSIDALSLDFPAKGSSAQVVANWLPQVAAKLTLPKGFSTTPVGGFSVKVSESQLSAIWSRFNGWSWSMFVNSPSITVAGTEITLGQNLNFDNQTSLKDLVTTGQAAFAPFLVAALGTLLIRTENRAGLFIAGTLGLSTDLSKSPIFPTGLNWSGFESFTINNFSNPWPDLRKQIASDFSTNGKAKGVLSLLSWTINSYMSDAPEIAGTGTMGDPYISPLPGGFVLPVWYAPETETLGLGIGRIDSYKYIRKLDGKESKIAFRLVSRLNLLEYALKEGSRVDKNNLPSLSFEGTLSNPDGALIDLPKSIGSVDKIVVGFGLALTNGNVSFTPVFTLLGVTLPGQSKRDSLTLQDFMAADFTASLQSAFLVLLNAGLQQAFTQTSGSPAFRSLYNVLGYLGLTLAREREDDPYAIDSAGWNALLSDFDTYIQAQLLKVLATQDARKQLFDLLGQLFQVDFPDFPQPLLDLLEGLGICGPAEEGYPLYPDAILELMSSPVDGLKQRFTNLFENPVALSKLTAAITQNFNEQQYGNFTFSSTSNGVVSLQVLPANAFEIGGFIQLTGGITLDLINKNLTWAFNTSCQKVGLTLATQLGLNYADNVVDAVFKTAIVWGDANKPAAAPLQLYPFNGDDFLNQLAELAPAYSLNILLNAVFEDQLLKKYPFVQQLFTGLGMAKQDGDIWQMDSLMGILHDPLGWLLSDSVLGYNGRFNVGALVSLLKGLPAVSSSNGIRLDPLENGVSISGLPYDFKIDATGNNGVADFNFSTASLSIAGGYAELDKLNLALQLDENYQPAMRGSLDISASKDLNIPFYVSAGYDKSFLLKITQGTPEQPSDLSVQLLPFLGWGTLAEQTARMSAVYLINEFTPQLLQKLSDAGANEFVDRMTTFAELVKVNTLVQNLLEILTPGNFSSKTQKELLQMLEASTLEWLQGLYTPTNAPDTVQAIITLLADVLPGQLKADAGRVSYKPSEKIPITIKAGLNSNSLLGLWADVELPGTELLKLDISETGMGISATGDVSFSFGAHVLVAVEGNNGPSLNLDYDAGKGFVLRFDPLGDASDFTKASYLSRELLPDFFPGTGTDPLSDRFTNWLLSIVKDVLPRYVSTLILNQASVRAWLDAPIVDTGKGNEAPSPALLLKASSIIVVDKDSKKYLLNTVDNLLALTPKTFFGNFLQTLMSQEITLLLFGKEKQCSIIIGPKKDKADYYGLRLFAPDLELDAVPNLVLQLGDKDNKWIVESGGTAGDPGIGIYLPLKTSGGDFNADFTQIALDMDNVGFDFRGTKGRPLVDLTRFTINKIEPRMLFHLQLNGSNTPSVEFGAGITLDGIGLSLAPNSMASGSSSNPIASNLLGAGDDDSSEANPPSNPAFSVSAAYCNKLWVNLKSDTGNGSQVIVPVQRSFGPLFVENLGLGWEQQEKVLDFLFSGSVSIAGLKASLIGLTVGVPVTNPTDMSAYKLDLQGIDISFEGGAVSLEAGLVKTTSPYLSYTGTAVIKASKFSLLAIGSYAEVPVSEEPNAAKVPSLFVFGVLNIPLGGPPAFFVTGVAAGFSYNRSIKIPPVEEVQNFPLVKGLTEGTFTDGEDPATALLKLSEVVAPEVGQYWLAAGISFTSFKLVNSSALLFVSFGKDFEINLLGLSYASLPPMVKQDQALAYFELAIKVSFKPSVGVISAQAQLTPNSFVLSRDCKVTGGFAFFLWYKTITTDDYTIPAGDFVISLGGYHPAFAKPVYYPEVPRLGMLWKMDVSVGKISINGGAYFALCPTAVMAGGYINVVFQAGPLKAWLNAYANFLIEWQPFYFNVGIGVTIGASFGTTIAGVSLTISAELGAKLQLEGPPTHGYVEVDWYVISFTIPIGSGKTATEDNNLNWEGFEQNFLPAPQQPDASLKMAGMLGDGQPVQQVVKWNADSGLINDNESLWLVQPVPFAVSVNSAIPVSKLSVSDSAFSQGGVSVGVRPMGYSADLNAPLIITLRDAGGIVIDPLSRQIKLQATLNGIATAMWSKSALDRKVAPAADDMIIPDAICGLLFSASNYVITGDVPAFTIDNLKYILGNVKQLPFTTIPNYPAGTPYPISDQNTAYQVIKSSIMDASVISRRNTLYEALRLAEINAPADPDLSVMASSAEMILQALPVIAPIDIYQNGEVSFGKTIPDHVASANKIEVQSPPVQEPELLGLFKAYKVSNGGMFVSGVLPVHLNAIRGKWQVTGGLLKSSKAALRTAVYSDHGNKTLHDGSIAIWKIDQRAPSVLHVDGSLPVQVFSFDPYHELISILPTDKGVSTLQLENGTAQVIVQGLAAMNDSSSNGWQWNTQLSKINPSWALGAGCMMRTQNSQRTTVDRYDNHIGVIDAGRLLDNNFITGAGKKRLPGWVETIFQPGIQYVAVLLDSPDAKADVIRASISINRTSISGDSVQPVDSQYIDGHTLLIYAVPSADNNIVYIDVLLNPLTANAMVKGVYGLREDDLQLQMENKQTQIKLAYSGIDTASTEIPSSIVTLSTSTT